jgi:hypothetical protein
LTGSDFQAAIQKLFGAIQLDSITWSFHAVSNIFGIQFAVRVNLEQELCGTVIDIGNVKPHL